MIDLAAVLALLEPLRDLKGTWFLAIYLVLMVGLPLLMGRQPAGLLLLVVGGLKLYLELSNDQSACFLMVLLGVTVFTHLVPTDARSGGAGGSCGAGGFFFFGAGGCGSTCGSSCGSSCGGGCGGGCGGCG